MSHHSPRMGEEWKPKMPKLKVTSVATEVASSSRRTNDGAFVCPSEWLAGLAVVYGRKPWLIVSTWMWQYFH